MGLHFRVLPAARSLSPEEVSVAKGIPLQLPSLIVLAGDNTLAAMWGPSPLLCVWM